MLTCETSLGRFDHERLLSLVQQCLAEGWGPRLIEQMLEARCYAQGMSPLFFADKELLFLLHRCESLQQLCEPPSTVPYARWCGKAKAMRLSPIPIVSVYAGRKTYFHKWSKFTGLVRP